VYTARLKAAIDEKSVLAGIEFHTGANWRRSSIANTCGCRCIHLLFVGSLNKRILIFIFVKILHDEQFSSNITRVLRFV